VREPVNPTASSKIPAAYRGFLDEMLRDDVRNLRERFGLSWAPPESGGCLVRVPPRQDPGSRVVFALAEG